jgi:transposase
MFKFLSKIQRKELLDELKIERSRRYAERIKVILLLDEGQTYKNISHFLFLDEGTIANYKKRYREGGLVGLITDDYKTKRTKLNEFEELQLADDVDLNFFLSAKEITFHVKNKFKITYSVSGMNNLLHRLGFTFKKAKGVPGKAKKSDQNRFLNIYRGLKPHGKVYFGDATHPLHNTILSYGWIKKGCEKEIFTNSGRNRVNIFGAISINDLDVVTKTYKTIDQFSVCDFLIKLREKNPNGEKLYLILDQGPSNKALAVRALAKFFNIKIIFLPAYSPNLNPIERLWKFFKKKVLYGQYYEKFQQFNIVCNSFFKGIQKYRSELKTLITDNFSTVGT